MYRRSCFQKNQIKRLMTMTTPCTVHQHVSIAVAGIAKVFVGELVEEALKVADNQNHDDYNDECLKCMSAGNVLAI